MNRIIFVTGLVAFLGACPPPFGDLPFPTEGEGEGAAAEGEGEGAAEGEGELNCASDVAVDGQLDDWLPTEIPELGSGIGAMVGRVGTSGEPFLFLGAGDGNIVRVNTDLLGDGPTVVDGCEGIGIELMMSAGPFVFVSGRGGTCVIVGADTESPAAVADANGAQVGTSYLVPLFSDGSAAARFTFGSIDYDVRRLAIEADGNYVVPATGNTLDVRSNEEEDNNATEASAPLLDFIRLPQPEVVLAATEFGEVFRIDDAGGDTTITRVASIPAIAPHGLHFAFDPGGDDPPRVALAWVPPDSKGRRGFATLGEILDASDTFPDNETNVTAFALNDPGSVFANPFSQPLLVSSATGAIGAVDVAGYATWQSAANVAPVLVGSTVFARGTLRMALGEHGTVWRSVFDSGVLAYSPPPTATCAPDPDTFVFPDQVNAVAPITQQGEDALLVATTRGVFQWNAGGGAPAAVFDENTNVTALATDDSGIGLFVTEEGGVFALADDGNGLIAQDLSVDLDPGVPDDGLSLRAGMGPDGLPYIFYFDSAISPRLLSCDSLGCTDEEVIEGLSGSSAASVGRVAAAGDRLVILTSNGIALVDVANLGAAHVVVETDTGPYTDNDEEPFTAFGDVVDVGDDCAILFGNMGHLYAINTLTGTTARATTAALPSPLLAGVLANPTTLYAAGFDDALYTLTLGASPCAPGGVGPPVALGPEKSHVSITAAAFAGDVLFVGDEHGVLWKLPTLTAP